MQQNGNPDSLERNWMTMEQLWNGYFSLNSYL